MNLKYSSIFLFIATSLFGGSALAANTIEFKGRIAESSCDVKINGDSSGTLELGTWAKNTFKDNDSKSTPVPFSIDVSDCSEDGVSNYYVSFAATPVSSNSKLIAVNGGAEGVGIGISNEGDYDTRYQINQIEVNEINIQDKVGTLSLQAFYERINGVAVKGGDATASAVVAVNMK